MSFVILLLSLVVFTTNGFVEDIFNSLFGNQGGGGNHHHVMQGGGNGQARTRDARTAVQVTLNDLYLGTKREISYNRNVICKHCKGSGAKDGVTKRCSKCRGQGQIIVEQQVMPGFRMQTQKVCPKCNGKGMIFAHKCRHCRGHGLIEENTNVEVLIEKGMENGQEIRFAGKAPEMPAHITGDLVVVLEQEKHPFFQREGNNLKTAVELTLTQALLGFDLNIEHLDGRWKNLKHNDITYHKKERVYDGEGMPYYRHPQRKGKLTIEFRVKFPKRIKENQINSLKNLFPELSLVGEYAVPI